VVLVSSQTAQKQGLTDISRVLVRQGSVETSMELAIDDGVADGCAWISAGTEASANLGPMFGSIELEAD
jgi:NADH-quinone oxidoreductase subunit G